GATYVIEDTTVGQIQVKNAGSTGLAVLTGAGSGEPNITTRNGAANLRIWDGQRFAVVNQTSIGGITWYEIDLPTLASQASGWVSGEYLDFSAPEAILGVDISDSARIVHWDQV